ncbi:MAG: S8 family serine peptidase [Anaerolineae bacterium]|nr:S8 family serine peptidase [Anaerolineae bacterium]
MRRISLAFLLSTVFLVALILFGAGPTLAQQPTPPPAKGNEAPPPAPGETPALPSLQIDRALLPKIEPQLLKRLTTQTGPAPFIVYLKATTNLSATVASTSDLGALGKLEAVATRAAIVNALQQTARDTQAGVLQQLNTPPAGEPAGQSQSAATNIQPLWIVNAVAATGNLETVLGLAARPDVAIVRLNKELQLNRPAVNGSALSWPLLAPFLTPHSSPAWGIAKIRANLVHNALGIDGGGVVVANIDTGVDWQHPALQTRYRGYTGPGKLPQHLGNWYDATGQGATYPVDTNGHGTHTMGTMVGDNGLGVAPGARWIAVKGFDNFGSAYYSWLHQAFQWILAPNGDPALAPNIVNNSWSSDWGADPEFQADAQALLAAGIYPVFSAGNNGPGSGTVGSPGSYTGAFAVGATTSADEIANFSSRGPSPWGALKPEVTAPGKDVRSTLPGGAYGELDGTSMAAPHAAGLAALLLQASPALANNLNGLSTAMMSTAVPLGSPVPNNTYGWGRIDAYNAVMSVASVGALQGNVTGAGGPLNNATVQIAAHGGGPILNATTDAAGHYHQGLAANIYDATAAAFGYAPATIYGLSIITNTTTTQNFSLSPLPTGTLLGTVKDKNTNAPLAATITIDHTPASAATNPATGSYSLNLPIGTYTATVVAAAHRISQTVNLTINDGATVTQNFLLDPAPTILLVDSGRWYQESEIGYYQQALADALYPYDTWSITNPFESPNDVPTAATLLNYDLVIWSAPLDSPGYVGANKALEDFLAGGRKLLLSGQDVAYFDGGGDIFVRPASYFKDYLKTSFVKENFSGVYAVSGVAGEPWAGLSLNISGGDGANNQTFPDIIANADSDFAGPLLAYSDGALAGLHVGLCVPYRAMFLPFGFEAINSRANRQAVMQQAINWLTQSPAAYGVELTPPQETQIGSFGAVVPHTVRLRNTGANNDSYTLSLSSGTPYAWPLAPAPPAFISLTTCQSQTLNFGVQAAATTWHISDTLTITARSVGAPGLTDVATRTTKTPAPVLLVDDDRWYSFAAEFKTALETNYIPYDYWYVPKSWSGPVPPSPPLTTLQMYPMIVWYTAYDWYQPLTTEEETRLAAYLDGGGRLFFSSQDYIYNLPDNTPGPFAQTYLGVLAHTEDYSSTTTTGQKENLVGHRLGPYALTFPPGYDNWTDALTPTTSAQIATVGQDGQPNGLTQAGTGPGGRAWQTNFLAYGPELLPTAARARLMQRSVGWLSWLGRSTVKPHVSTALDGDLITYTAALTNNGWTGLTAIFTATLPAELALTTASPGLIPSGNNLVWTGPLAPNQSQVLTYTVAITSPLPLGTLISQTSWLAYPEHNLVFDRIADVYVNFPFLNASAITVQPAYGVEPNDVLTYTLILKNTGLVDDPMVTTTNTLPPMLSLVSVGTPSRGSVIVGGKSITWTTPLSKNQTATLTYQALIDYRPTNPAGHIQNTAYVNDNLNEPLVLTASAAFYTHPMYLPIIVKQSQGQ